MLRFRRSSAATPTPLFALAGSEYRIAAVFPVRCGGALPGKRRFFRPIVHGPTVCSERRKREIRVQQTLKCYAFI